MILDLINEIPQLHAELRSSYYERYSSLLSEFPDLFSASLSIPLFKALTFSLLDSNVMKLTSSIIDTSIAEISCMNKHLYQFYHTIGQSSQLLYSEIYNMLNLDIRTFDHYIYPIIGDLLAVTKIPYRLFNNLSIVNIIWQANACTLLLLSILMKTSPRLQYSAKASDRIYQICIAMQKLFEPINPKRSILTQADAVSYHFLNLIYREFMYSENSLSHNRIKERISRNSHAGANIGNYYAFLGKNVDKDSDAPRNNINGIITQRIYEDPEINSLSIGKACVKIARSAIWSIAYTFRFILPTFDDSEKGDVDQIIMFYMLPSKIMEKKRNEYSTSDNNEYENITLKQKTVHYDDTELEKNTISKILKTCEQEIGWPRSFLYIPAIHSQIFQPKYKIGDFYYSIYEALCIAHSFAEISSNKFIITQQELQRLTISGIGYAGNMFSCLFNIQECLKKAVILNILLEAGNIPTINMQTFIRDALLKTYDYERVVENMYSEKNWLTQFIENKLKDKFVLEQTLKARKMYREAIRHNKISQAIKLRQESEETFKHLLENIVNKIDEDEISSIFFSEERSPNYKIHNYSGASFAIVEYVDITLPLKLSSELNISVKLNVETNSATVNTEDRTIHKVLSILTNIHSIQDILYMITYEMERLTFDSQFKYAHTYGATIQEAPWRLLEHLKYEIEQYVPDALSILMPSSMININAVYYAYLHETLKAPYIQAEDLSKTKIPILSSLNNMAFHSPYIETFVFFNHLSGYKGFNSWSLKHHSLNRVFTNIFWKSLLIETVDIPINYIKHIISKLPKIIIEIKGELFQFTFDIKKMILGRHYQMEAYLKSNTNMQDIFTSKITPLINEALSRSDRYPILNIFNLIASSFSLGSIVQPKGSSFALCTGYANSKYRSSFFYPFSCFHAPIFTSGVATRDMDMLNAIRAFPDAKVPFINKYNKKINSLMANIKNAIAKRMILSFVRRNYNSTLLDIIHTAFTLSGGYFNKINYMVVIPLKSYFLYGDTIISKLTDFEVYSPLLSEFFALAYGKNADSLRFEFNFRETIYLQILQTFIRLDFTNITAPIGLEPGMNSVTYKLDGNQEIKPPLFLLSEIVELTRATQPRLTGQNLSVTKVINIAIDSLKGLPHLIPHLFSININTYNYNISKNMFKTKRFIPYHLVKHHNISFNKKNIFYKEINSSQEIYSRFTKNIGISINPSAIAKIFLTPIHYANHMENYWLNYANNQTPGTVNRSWEKSLTQLIPHLLSTIKYTIYTSMPTSNRFKKILNTITKAVWFSTQFYSPENINFIELGAQDPSATIYINSKFGTIAIGINPEYLTQPSTFQFINIEFFGSVDLENKHIEHVSANKIIGVKPIW